MKNRLIIIATSLLIGIILSLLFWTGFFNSWRYTFLDKLFLDKEPTGKVVIVAIDNESLQYMGRWPWDRSITANLVRKISENNPSVIGLDVNFPEKSIDIQDKDLGSAISESGRVILPIEVELLIEKETTIARGILKPVEDILKGALDLGVSNTPPDKDGIFRRLPMLLFNDEGDRYLSFSLAVAKSYFDGQGGQLPLIPVDSKKQMIVNYVGKPGSIQTVSAKDVIEGNVLENVFKNKIVLIGATAPDLHDEQMTPVSSGVPMSGVEIHANIIETVLTENFLRFLDFRWQIFLFILLSLVICVALNYFSKIYIGSLISFLALACYFVFAFIVFDIGIIADLFYPLLIFTLIYIAVVVWRYFTEKKEKQQIKSAFAHYVSPAVIEDLLIHPDKLKLGGEKREITILFSDIRGFTSISEKLSPEKLVSLLNDYLSSMTDLIMNKRGVVDKYIGDAVMAFWGAPLTEPLHTEYALETAIDMIKILKDKQPEWQEEYGVDLRIGIGLNRGNAIIGNMGSDQRFDYTAMGDTINLGSRLEGLTKQYGVKIIVSESVKEAVSNQFTFRFLDKVAVKGKEEGVNIFEAMGYTEELSKEEIDLKNWFEKGIELYRNQNWEKGFNFFQTLLLKYPDNLSIKLYADRCREFCNCVPKDWDGVYHAKSK